jgi:hypothetical protein
MERENFNKVISCAIGLMSFLDYSSDHLMMFKGLFCFLGKSLIEKAHIVTCPRLLKVLFTTFWSPKLTKIVTNDSFSHFRKVAIWACFTSECMSYTVNIYECLTLGLCGHLIGLCS